MKASFKFIFAALAATAALAACTKEITPPNFENDKVAPASEGSRVIAVSFAPQTKTYLDKDGLTPKFEGKEKIMVSNTLKTEECEVSVDANGNASFTTSLPGTLTAVYPAAAANISDNAINGVLVSIVQSGKFAAANICMAENITTSATFENKTAVFRIIPEAEDISYLEVTTPSKVWIANSAPEGSEFWEASRVRVEVPSTKKPKEYFVSILVTDGLTIGKLSFSDGTNVKTVTGARASEPVAASTIYKVTVPKSYAVTCEPVTITGASFRVMKESKVVTKATPGDELKVEVTCPNGYIVGGITVCKTGDPSTTVTVTDGGFTMPGYSVTVSVELELDESGGGTEMEHGGLLG